MPPTMIRPPLAGRSGLPAVPGPEAAPGPGAVPGPGAMPGLPGLPEVVSRTGQFPRLRYMGSKYRLIPHLARAFTELGGAAALDAFSGSGVVSYLLKTCGYQVTANDFLTFPAIIARASVVNQAVTLSAGDIATICGPPADDRDFIGRTFGGIYFTDADLQFLDSAWSHIDRMEGHKQALAISALVLSAARRQPRGVFTVTGLRYDDGRRDLRLPLRDHFAERAAEYNRVIFDSGQRCAATSCDVFDLPRAGYDVVYLDPPYAPPRDDNCYIKRYTPFSYKHTVTAALRRAIRQFADSALVLSYSSNAVPDAATIEGLLREVKRDVEVRAVDHTYAFGTHQAARRRTAREYLFIAR